MNDMKAPRVRPGVRRFAIVAFVILLPIAAHALWDYLEVRRLVREIVRIRDSGEPVAERDLGPTAPESPEQKSAARLYLAAGAAAVPTYDIDRAVPADLQTATYTLGQDAAVRERLVRRLEAVLSPNADALALLDKATPLDFVAFGPGTEYSFRTASVWTLTGVNELRAGYLCLTGKTDAAVEAAIVGFRLFRVDRFRAWWAADLRPGFRMVPFILSHCPPDAEALARLQQAAEATSSARTIADALVRESMTDRARFLSRIWSQYGFDVRAPEAVTFRSYPIEQMVLRPWLTHLAVRELHDRAELIAAERLPAQERLAAVEALRQRHAERRVGGPFARGMVLGGVAREVPSMMGSFAYSGASIAAIAVARYRLDHNQQLPPSLDALVPQYLKAIPIDPFTDAPIRYVSRPGEYAVYSVGRDGKDDGGDLRPGPPPWRSGRPTPSRDLGVLIVTTRSAK